MCIHRLLSRRLFTLWALLLLMTLLITAPTVRGQNLEPAQTKPLIFYPQRLSEGAWWNSVGFTAGAPPVEITEALQVRWPAFDYHTLYGLPKGFLLDGRATVQVLQNRLSAGPKWASAVGPVSFSIGWDLAYWFGALTVGQFDSKAHGWESTPNITLGYQLGDVAASLKSEAIYVHSLTTYQADLEVGSTKRTFAGYAFTITLEQPFYKDQYLTLGFRAMYTKFYWMTWSLFPTFDRYLFFPEIIVGWIL